MIRSVIRSVANFVRYRNPAERKARKYLELFGFYFLHNLEIVNFSRDAVLSELEAQTICGYAAGFIDTALVYMGEDIGSAPAFIAIHIIITDEFGDTQKHRLVSALLCRDSISENANYLRACEIGSEDATAYIEQKQKYNLGKFLYQELRLLCKVTSTDLITQLSAPRKI